MLPTSLTAGAPDELPWPCVAAEDKERHYSYTASSEVDGKLPSRQYLNSEIPYERNHRDSF